MATSMSWAICCEQVPSGLRAATPRPRRVPVKLPAAWRNAPVPPRILSVCRIPTLFAQVCGLTDGVTDLFVVTRCIVPRPNTRLSRLTLSGSPGRFATSTTRPSPVKTPPATITVLTTVRVPDSPEATITPRNDCLPVVRAAAGATVATSVSPIAKSVPRAAVTSRLIVGPYDRVDERRTWRPALSASVPTIPRRVHPVSSRAPPEAGVSVAFALSPTSDEQWQPQSRLRRVLLTRIPRATWRLAAYSRRHNAPTGASRARIGNTPGTGPPA